MSTSSVSSIPLLSLPCKPKLPLAVSVRPAFSSSAFTSFCCSSIPKAPNGFRNRTAKLSIFACSTSPFIGRVGLQWREGNVSLLSFGINPNAISEVGKKGDSSQALSAMLPFVVAATAIAALAQPSTFTWVSKELYAPALGGIMLSIGIRLSINDFALAFKRPIPLSIGFVAQYVLKPALGVLIARAFGMSRIFYAGFVLMSCVAGAQLSSYASFLSKGDVALSILLTSSTTIASVLVTPLLTGLLLGSVVPVDAVAMSKSILQARRRSQQDDFIMHWNAKFHPGRAPCNPIPWEQSSSSTSMFGSCHGYNGPFSCLFLGQWISNQRPAFQANATRWFYR
ncbi:hypothetical protein I3843_13G048500 [Carya illinoinensis]|nr:hypothetical protein I3843_13G048500 [Carya illinoinensis]